MVGPEPALALVAEPAVDLEEEALVGQVHPFGPLLHLVGHEIETDRGAVEDDVDEPGAGRERETGLRPEAHRQVGAQRGAVGVVGEQHPLVVGLGAQQRGVLGQLDLVGLLGPRPRGVATALDLDRARDAVEHHRGVDVVVLARDRYAALGRDGERSGRARQDPRWRARRWGGRACCVCGSHRAQESEADECAYASSQVSGVRCHGSPF